MDGVCYFIIIDVMGEKWYKNLCVVLGFVCEFWSFNLRVIYINVLLLLLLLLLLVIFLSIVYKFD